jgi:hypothetical protein
MVLVWLLGMWLGVREYLGAAGLIFGGYGEAYLLIAAFFLGYLLCRWGNDEVQRRG